MEKDAETKAEGSDCEGNREQNKQRGEFERKKMMVKGRYWYCSRDRIMWNDGRRWTCSSRHTVHGSIVELNN